LISDFNGATFFKEWKDALWSKFFTAAPQRQRRSVVKRYHYDGHEQLQSHLNGAQVRRILALALVLEGKSRSEAASLNGMDRQTLSDWVHRYNAYGIKGLRSRKSPGREPALTAAQKAELRELVIQGPDPAVHKVVRWRRVDLQAEVARRWSIEMHPNTIGAWLGEMGLTRLQPRPVHPKKNAAAEATFKNFASLVRKALNGTTSGTPVEIWFQDEARVGQQGTHAYIWAEPAKVRIHSVRTAAQGCG
jgi:transposase